MTRLKTASLAILGTAAIVVCVLASPAMAKDTMAKATMAKNAKYTQAQNKGSQTLARQQRQVQRHATSRSKQFRNANAAMTSKKKSRGAARPGEVVGNVATATAPFGVFGGSFGNSYNNYGYGYGGRDWKAYAARNGLACAPGTSFKGADGRLHRCQ